MKQLVCLVYEQRDLMWSSVVKVFASAADALKFCEEKNAIHKPEFDSYGYCGGVFHYYIDMEVE